MLQVLRYIELWYYCVLNSPSFKCPNTEMAKNKADKICELESEQVAVLPKVIHGKSRSQENRAPFSVWCLVSTYIENSRNS